ncbi:hypothetical protein KSS87_013192, partial [Heliosperma pusillum]
MKAMANSEKSARVRKVKAPQPRTYNGARNSKVVDNFIFDVEQYFRVSELDEALKKILKDHFYPKNTEFVAQKKLKEVKHTNSIRDYVREFSACMLEISDMSETVRTFEFINGLKRWAQQEVMRQNRRTLSAAISAAERLLDFHGERESAPSKTPSGYGDAPQSE